MNNLVFLLAGVVLITACTKEKIVEVPKEIPTAKATISFAQPKVNATFHNGDTVHILATIAAPAELHGYSVSVRSEEDEKEVFFAHIHGHGRNLTVDTFWVSHVAAEAAMSVKIDAIVDHDGNTAGKEIPFTSKP